MKELADSHLQCIVIFQSRIDLMGMSKQLRVKLGTFGSPFRSIESYLLALPVIPDRFSKA